MCAPAAPNPKDTSAAQSASNFMSATANTYGQNGNYTTPDGTRSSTFTKNPVYDPYTGKTFEAVTPNVTETLSPAQAAIKAQNDKAKLGYGTLANSQIDKLQTTLKDPFSFNTQDHTKWAGDMYGKLNNERFANDAETTRARLANMGIRMGTEPYDREMSRLEKSQGSQRDQFSLDSLNQDFQMQQATRNQGVNESTALATGGQVSQPNFGINRAGTVATTDNAGIINQDYQNRLAASQSMGSNVGGILGGIGSLAAAPVMPWIFSDKRLKENVKKVGEINGQDIHKYNYKGEKGLQLGLIAQKVEKKKPHAVRTTPSGYKQVNYGLALGM
jgi:Chaperone of endosialidase